MSMDEWEAQQEEQYLEFIEEHRGPIVEEFRAEQLQSYYAANPNLALPARRFLADARALCAQHASAAQVLATASIEVGIKVLLLRPLLSGLVHTDALAPALIDVVFGHHAMNRLEPLLLDLLKQCVNFDLKAYQREGSSENLLKEIEANAKVRHGVVHRCESASAAQAAQAVSLADEVLERIYPRVVEALGFHLHEGVLCRNYHIPADLQAILDSEKTGPPEAGD